MRGALAAAALLLGQAAAPANGFVTSLTSPVAAQAAQVGDPGTTTLQMYSLQEIDSDVRPTRLNPLLELLTGVCQWGNTPPERRGRAGRFTWSAAASGEPDKSGFGAHGRTENKCRVHVSVERALINGLNHSHFPLLQAVCNDGSPAAYFYSPGSGTGADIWLVYLEVRLCLENGSGVSRRPARTSSTPFSTSSV